jgi:hypothetical protein
VQSDTAGLLQARSFANAGRNGAADTVYELYLNDHPESYEARVEYIRFLIKAKFRTKARLYCISGIKRSTTDAQKNELWSLWKQVLTN